MPAKEYDYLKDTILVTYPDGSETYGATQAAPSSGVDTSDATAVADDIRLDKTAYVASGKVTGTIEDYDGSTEPASGKSLFGQRIDGSLTEVNAGDLAGITKIWNYAFQGCSSLTSIKIPDSVTSIGNDAFTSCSNLISVMIPDSVTSIGDGAFSGCSSLTSITIPEGVTKINWRMFNGCARLTNAIIGKNVRDIMHNAFNNCGVLTGSGTIYILLPIIPPTLQSDVFINVKINKIIVPAGTADAYKAATNWSALADYIEEAEA